MIPLRKDAALEKIMGDALPILFTVTIEHPEMVGVYTHRSHQPSPVHARNEAVRHFAREHNSVDVRYVTITVKPTKAGT